MIEILAIKKFHIAAKPVDRGFFVTMITTCFVRATIEYLSKEGNCEKQMVVHGFGYGFPHFGCQPGFFKEQT
jgi:hypothetical protein